MSVITELEKLREENVTLRERYGKAFCEQESQLAHLKSQLAEANTEWQRAAAEANRLGTERDLEQNEKLRLADKVEHMQSVITVALRDTVLGAGTMRVMLEDCLR